MEYFLEALAASFIVIVGPLLTLVGLPGNTLMLLAGIGFACFDEAKYFDGRILSALVLIYVFGELWEFIVSFFGIRRHKLPWSVVGLIGIGTFIGAVLGTGVFPVFGSVLGGAMGSFVMAFVYEYSQTMDCDDAFELAWKAAKLQFIAIIGKVVAAAAMAILLVKQIFLNT